MPNSACLLFVCLAIACGSEQSTATHRASALEKPVDSGIDAGCAGYWCPPPPDCGTGQLCPDAGESYVTVQNLGATGLYTSPSFLTSAPAGSALVADNLVVDKPGEYTTRRGFERLPAALPGNLHVGAWTVYQNTFIAHAPEASTLYRYVSGAWTAYPGLYDAPSPGVDANGDPLPGHLVFKETQQALYFTSTSGIYRLEGVSEVPQVAGVSPALTGTASVYQAGQALSPNSVTAYRYVWGRRATNGRVMLGAPSGRIAITNRSEGFTFSPSAMSRTSNVVTVTVTSGVAANLLVGQTVNLTALAAGADTTAFGPVPAAKVITAKTSTSFSYAETGADATAATPASASFTSVATAVDIAHTVQVPEFVDEDYFFQAYRSDEVPLNAEPSDEMYLVHEKAVSDMAPKHTILSMFRVGAIVTVNMDAPHGLVAGNHVTLTNDFTVPADAANFPPGIKTVDTVLDADTFQYVESGPAVALAGETFFMWLFSYSFVDGTPDALKGDSLYTNANAGGSISASHYVPPKAAIETVFNDRMVYANTELKERINITLLGVGGQSGLNIGQGLKFIYSNGASETYTAGSAETLPSTFQLYTTGTPAQNVANTLTSLARVISASPNGRLYARYDGVGANLLGGLAVESRYIAENAVTVEALQRGDMWFPALRAAARVSVGQMSRNASGVVTVFTTMTTAGVGHGFTVGQTIEVLPSANPTDLAKFPPGRKTITDVPTIDSFRYLETGATGSNVAVMAISSTATEVTTDDERAPGGYMVSDVANPDSVPAVLPEIVGDRYKRILFMVQVGNTLFFGKEDGLFRLIGTDPTNFTTDCVDPTVRFVSPRAVWVLNGRAYALTSQGLASWTESTQPVATGLPIEDILRNAVENFPNLVSEYSFAVSHESKRRAYLWLPDADGNANALVYVLNATTGEVWTRWAKPALAALIHPTEDRLWIAPPDADGTGTAPAPAHERNTGTAADYQDEDGQSIQATLQWVPQRPPETTQQEQVVRTVYNFAGPTPTQVEVAYSTNWVPTPLWFTLDASSSQSPGTFSTVPDWEHSRGDFHSLLIRHAVVQQPLRVLGYSAFTRYWARGIP